MKTKRKVESLQLLKSRHYASCSVASLITYFQQSSQKRSEVNWMQDIIKIIAVVGLGTWYGIALLLMSTIVYKTISD